MLKLRELRLEHNISQEKLAKIINVKNYTIGNWEQERSEPSIDEIVALADYFQISTDELLGRKNFATGNIEIVGEKINDKEKQLLLAFRNLDQDGQTAFLDIADNLSKIYKQNKTVS